MHDTFEPVIDVFVSILYLGGMAIIEVGIRPLFREGVPLIANIVLYLGDAILFFNLLSRLFRAADHCWVTVRDSSIYQSFKKKPKDNNGDKRQNGS